MKRLVKNTALIWSVKKEITRVTYHGVLRLVAVVPIAVIHVAKIERLWLDRADVPPLVPGSRQQVVSSALK